MNKEEILIAIKEIQCRYCLPALEKNFTDKDYAIQQFEKLVIHLANQQEKKDKEIERLNNIINEFEKWLEEQHQFIIEIPAYTKEIAMEHKTMEICYENVLDKLQELKGDSSNE